MANHTSISLADAVTPSVDQTFVHLPDAGVVIVPWRVFVTNPATVSEEFSFQKRKLHVSERVNLMTNLNCSGKQPEGELKQFSETWVMNTESHDKLTSVIERLTSGTTVVKVTLLQRQLIGSNIQIPLLLFIKPSSIFIQNLLTLVDEAKERLNINQKFCLEVDLGPSIKKWAKDLFGQDFVCIGGRFCLTNGDIFNHLFDWENIFGCLPLLPCCLLASPIYRVRRKCTYFEQTVNVLGDLTLTGARGHNHDEQRTVLIELMKWAGKPENAWNYKKPVVPRLVIHEIESSEEEEADEGMDLRTNVNLAMFLAPGYAHRGHIHLRGRNMIPNVPSHKREEQWEIQEHDDSEV